MAAKTNWSDIVPNFDSMPEGMQQWLMTNLPTFISQAIQEGLQQGFDQHWGVAATGNSYHLVGTDHTHAVMGDHNEVVGGVTTRTRQDSVMTHNFADEIKVTEGAHSHQVNNDTFYLTLGTENRTVASHQATAVGGDHSLLVDGNSAMVSATHTVIAGTGNTDDSVVTYSETITGSRYQAVSGTHYIQSGAVVRSVGGPLSTNFTPPTLPPPPPKENPDGLSDGAIAHPSLAQALGQPAQPVAAATPTATAATSAPSLSQHAAKQNTSAQQKQRTAAQPQPSAQQLVTQTLNTEQRQLSGSTDQTKAGLNDSNMAWQIATGGAATIVTAGLALSSSKDPMPTVQSTNYAGSTQDNIEGNRTTTVLGAMSDSFLGGANTFTNGSASDTVLGMAGDTIIGLSSDALIGLAMPFTLISMGQVLLNMDEDVCVVESKSFKLDIAGMKITTPGGATWGGKAAEEATELEKAEKLLEDAEHAEQALKDAEETVKAAEEAKLAKDAADLKAAEKGKEIETQTKETEALQKAAKEKSAAAVTKSEEWASKYAKDEDDAQAFDDLQKATDEMKQAEKAAEDSEKALKTMKEEKELLDVVAESKNVKILEKTAHSGEDLSFLGKDTTLGKFFNVSKDSTALGAFTKTLAKGGDWAKVFGGTDAAIASVKLAKATVKSVSKGLSTMNRNQIAKNQSKAVENDPKTKEVDGEE